MRKLLIALAVLTSPWVLAHEADKDLDSGHWYVEGAYSLSQLKDGGSRVDSDTVTTDCDEFLVFPGELGCDPQSGESNLDNSVTLFPNGESSGGSQTFDTEYDSGDGYEASIGYDFSGPFRLDLNYIEFESDIETFDGNAATGTVESQQLMANVWVDFNESGLVQPYIGAGLGAAKVEIGDADDTVLTAQAGLGLNVAVTSHLKVNLGYRYFEGKDPEFTNASTSLTPEYSGERFVLGFRYDFLRDAADADNDGVADASDRCPETPLDADVDGFGCPLDADQDRVDDYQDDCLGTPAGVRVDERGCDIDGDADGVTNSLDQCPETPTGSRVLANGCQTVVLQGVNFGTNGAELTSGAIQVCIDVAEVLNAPTSADLNVELQGHTDDQGSSSYNMYLSQKRAESVRNCLIANDVAAERLHARGYGESQPIASNETADGRAENRRTEMKVLND